MFSTVLDCRQSLSEVSLCFSTWLRGHRLGCTAFVRQGSKDVNWFQTSCRKALIDIEVIPNKTEACVLLGLCNFQSSQRMLHFKMARRYHIKMATRFTAEAWTSTGIDFDWHRLLSLLCNTITSSVQFL